MKTDKSQDKYQDIFQELKEEKMNWDFEDFLTQAEEKTIPITAEKKGATFPKFYWMAASVVLLASLGIFFIINHQNEIALKDNLVKNEILKQKNDFHEDHEIVAIHTVDSVKTVQDSLLADSVSVTNDEELMDKILPKRGRLRKQTKPHFAQMETTEKPTQVQEVSTADYKPNYVIINGQKIENEKDAIDLTKYSFRILSKNVSQTMAKTEALTNLSTD